MNSDMESFGLIDDNGGSNPSIQSSHRSPSAIGLMPTMHLSSYSTDSVAVYKPLMPGASPPPPSSPAQAYQPLEDDSTLPLPPLHQPDIVIEQTKRKRGRPRKYSPDGKVVPGFRSSSSQRKQITSTPSGKKRGRPPGSSRKYQEALGGRIDSSSNGSEFTPHIITVNAGEDISSKIRSLAQSASQTVCIISANGEISSVTICRALTCGGTVTYEGRFQIINLSGFYTFSESVGQHTTTSGLSILLSGSDGHILGGGVAGALIAASSVQVVVGSFNPGEELSKHVKQTEVEPSKVLTGTWSVGSPLSRGTMSECSGGPGSPFNLSSGVCNNSMQQDMGTISWK